MVSGVRPPVADLDFRVYGRPLHPELFDVLAFRRLRHADFDLAVRITRTGHVISWEDRNVHLTEVTSASGQELPLKRLLHSHRLRQEHAAVVPCLYGVHYQSTSQVEAASPEVFAQIHGEILSDGEKRGFLHHFGECDPRGLAPLGFVLAEFRPGCLFLTSFHTFPSENTVVKTQSLIERR